jgi:hypothetical protein
MSRLVQCKVGVVVDVVEEEREGNRWVKRLKWATRQQVNTEGRCAKPKH